MVKLGRGRRSPSDSIFGSSSRSSSPSDSRSSSHPRTLSRSRSPSCSKSSSPLSSSSSRSSRSRNPPPQRRRRFMPLLFEMQAQIDGNAMKARFTLPPRQKVSPPPKVYVDTPRTDNASANVDKDGPKRVELEARDESYDVIIGDLPDPIDGGPCYKLYTKC
ncbi:uncharacterized protein LOC114397085 [Glycine soja]|uniref:uncharacterized protein LOC114397085 n=1 Tax=Glycine soja TaxID=3848 RepID=UPI00104036AF|nr:uncharacterized protein LOC114397085 [Glycine soja]